MIASGLTTSTGWLPRAKRSRRPTAASDWLPTGTMPFSEDRPAFHDGPRLARAPARNQPAAVGICGTPAAPKNLSRHTGSCPFSGWPTIRDRFVRVARSQRSENDSIDQTEPNNREGAESAPTVAAHRDAQCHSTKYLPLGCSTPDGDATTTHLGKNAMCATLRRTTLEGKGRRAVPKKQPHRLRLGHHSR